MNRSDGTTQKQNFGLWDVWIDTGGTFTDCLARDARGILHREKVLSNSSLRGTIAETLSGRVFRVDVPWSIPSNSIRGFRFGALEPSRHELPARVEAYDSNERTIEIDRDLQAEFQPGSAFEIRSTEEAPILAARLATKTPADSPFPEMSLRLATTLGTNALLERKGAPTALFITEGFGDLLRIGDQQRSDLFTLNVQKTDPLYVTVVEVPERLAANGAVLKPLRPGATDTEIRRVLEQGIRCAAVVFMHSYVNPSHEREFTEYLLGKGFRHVSLSSDLAPSIRILPRAETAVVDSYLAPVLGDYLTKVRSPLANGGLHVMTSAGGLVAPESFNAKDGLLSGPAGGVVGAARAGHRSGFSKIIAFDMGGTSTDVARFDGEYDYVFEHEIADVHLVAPALAIETVAAGGGSICGFDGTKLRVGPESAGAEPGPACYGAGGPLTLTDVNLLLGWLDGSRFDIPIEKEKAKRAFEVTTGASDSQRRPPPGDESYLEGFRDIANERMADAIRRISIRKGYDPTGYALVAFGGAGGQHACAVAGHLGIDTIIVPRDASLLSASGLGYAAMERFAERQILKRLDAVEPKLADWMRELADEAAAALEDEGVVKNRIQIRRRIVTLRFLGQDSVLQVEYGGDTPLPELFESQYRVVFGHWQKDRPIEVESIRVVASSRRPDEPIKTPKTKTRSVAARRCQQAYFDGGWRSVPAYERDDLPKGAHVNGPALVFERYSTTVVEPGWTADVDDAGALVIERTAGDTAAARRTQPEVVRLELFTGRFRAVAREMGEMLRRTAISTNVKERLDFSCAVLDADGRLVVNAPHIPIHLGAIGICVREIAKAVPMDAGDVVVTNHPKYGGSHLPDVTVVTPVYLSNGHRVGYVANRAHHAEIGGRRPGSMPPTAKTLAEEGVVIGPTHLFKNGKPCWDELTRLLSEAPFPSRAVEENLADVRAAVAANRNGAAALAKLAEQYGEDTVRHYMAALKDRAERKVRDAIRRIPDGTYEAVERLDDGSPLCVRIEINGDAAVVDFSGSASVHPGNLNTTPAVVHSVVIYAVRLLVDEPLPLNEGLLRAIDVRVPPGMLSPPFSDDPAKAPAVVGGNVETSQRLVDLMLRALSLAACSQGTMNNVLFGNKRFSYYETVCGGTGAGRGFDGASAVHSHMTNTRITDPEIVEHRYPVRVERFAVRRGSGGGGKHRGGDGAVREITFLEEMSLSVLGQHRTDGPYGLEGGEPGAPARLRVVRATGVTKTLGSVDGCDVGPGDRFVLETPGGGGFGAEEAARG